jgi:O-antigen/teichoic acid export membrane protein
MSARALSGSARRFGGLVSMLFTGAVASAAMSLLAQLLLTRSLPVAEFGRLAALLAVINFLTPVGAAGANYFLLRAFGREGYPATRWVRPCTILVACGSLAACAALIAYATGWSTPGTSGRALMLAACAPILLGQIAIELAAVRFQLEGRFHMLSIWQCTTQAGRFAVALWAIAAFASLPLVLLGYALVGVVSVGIAAGVLLRLWQGRVSLEGHALPAAPQAGQQTVQPSWREAAPNVAPFALMTMFYVVYFQGPVAVLEWFRGGAPAGIYNSAFLIISAISLIPTVVYMRLLLPRINRWAEHNRAVFTAAFQVGVPVMAMLGLLCMAGVMTTGPWLLPLLFGKAYATGVMALMILALSIPVRFVQTVFSSLFVSEQDMLRKSGFLAASAVIGFSASMLLVPYASVIGAAIATVTAETALLVLHVVGTSRFIHGIAVADVLRFATFRSALAQLQQAESNMGA